MINLSAILHLLITSLQSKFIVVISLTTIDWLDNEMNFSRDAQNAIRNINDLQRTVDGKRKGIVASFKHDRTTRQLDVDQMPPVPQMPAVVTNPK